MIDNTTDESVLGTSLFDATMTSYFVFGALRAAASSRRATLKSVVAQAESTSVTEAEVSNDGVTSTDDTHGACQPRKTQGCV